MNVFTTPAPIIITCNKRLTPYLEQEVKEEGFQTEESFVTGVRLTGTVNDCIKLNLNLRTASQVLYSIRQFQARDGDEIYKALVAFEWENIIDENTYFSVTSNVDNPTINNNLYANLRVKDAIVDRFKEKKGIRPSTGSDLTGAVIHLYWKNDFAEIFIDTSGDSLARHGYRKIPGRAPMLEALAASTIMATRWDKRSPFVNPMCGSGTLAIEAALLATNTRPGLFRINFAFMHLKGYDETVFLNERGALENKIIDVRDLRIIATDYSDQAITNARKNAMAAGVEDMIDFSVCDFAETEVPPGAKGVVFLNPEYGERLGDIKELHDTYGRIGDFMKQKCGGYFGYIFTGNLDLAKKIGLKPSRKIEFYTSTIDSRLFEYELYEGSRRVSQ
jgi:putative N6-adenine-specific DNA methylase